MALRFDRAKSSMDVDESTWWRRYKAKLFRLVSGDTIRYGVTIIMCFFGVMCVFGAVIIPVRVVHKLVTVLRIRSIVAEMIIILFSS